MLHLILASAGDKNPGVAHVLRVVVPIVLGILVLAAIIRNKQD